VLWALLTSLLGAIGVFLGVRECGFRIGYLPAVYSLWFGSVIGDAISYGTWKPGSHGHVPQPQASIGVGLGFVVGWFATVFLVDNFARKATWSSRISQPSGSSGAERAADLVETVFRVSGRPDAVSLGRGTRVVGDVITVANRSWRVEGEERPEHPTAMARYVLRPVTDAMADNTN
jgi:hypothetical protein